MKKRVLMLVLLMFSILFSGCATPEVVDVRKIGDSNLTCEQIKKEMEDADEFEKKARRERKPTGKNVAAAVFFFPALLGTYSNTEEAITAARDRKEYLLKLADSKNCKL